MNHCDASKGIVNKILRQSQNRSPFRQRFGNSTFEIRRDYQRCRKMFEYFLLMSVSLKGLTKIFICSHKLLHGQYRDFITWVQTEFSDSIEVISYNRRKIKFKGCSVSVQSYYDKFNCKKIIKESGDQVTYEFFN